ncbi:MAG: helix-turn-helix domain-containing protein, partial [Tepidiforma sp.]
LTVPEVSRVLRVSERSLREWLYRRRDGQPVIPHVRLGRRVLIRREWVEQILTGTTQPPGGHPGAAE